MLLPAMVKQRSPLLPWLRSPRPVDFVSVRGWRPLPLDPVTVGLVLCFIFGGAFALALVVSSLVPALGMSLDVRHPLPCLHFTR